MNFNKTTNPAALICICIFLVNLSCSIFAPAPAEPKEVGILTNTNASQAPTIVQATATSTAPDNPTTTPANPTPAIPTEPPFPTQAVRAPVDRSDPQSVLDSVREAVDTSDLAVFGELIFPEYFFYANVIEGGQLVSLSELTEALNQRLPSRPVCLGFFVEEDFLQIWYDGWQPAWMMNEICYDTCRPLDKPWYSETAGFLFQKFDGEFYLRSLYLNTPEKYYSTNTSENPPLVSCDQKANDFATTTPASSCPGAPPQRLKVGDDGKVCTKSDSVILRSQPKRASEAIKMLPRGTTFDVISGPECGGNNWSWWKVRTANGKTGWLAEGGDAVDPYFLCPLP